MNFRVNSPGLGPGIVGLAGTGKNQGIFSKIAMPLGHGVSAGILLSHEVSSFDGVSKIGQTVHYETEWRPSGGGGIAWQVNPQLLVGARVILNSDFERRTDPAGVPRALRDPVSSVWALRIPPGREDCSIME